MYLYALAPEFGLGVDGGSEDEVSVVVGRVEGGHRRMVAHLLANDAKLVALQLVGLAQQGVERFAHAIHIGGQGADGEGGHQLDPLGRVFLVGGHLEQVGVVHVLAESLQKTDRLVPLDGHGDLAELFAHALL